MRLPSLAFATITLLLPSLVLSQDKAESKDSQVKTEPEGQLIEFSPAVVPKAVLENPLLPTRLTTVRGNAAVLYYRACLLANKHGAEMNKFQKKFRKYSNTSSSEFPVEDARKSIEVFNYALAELRLAALRRDCEWQLPVDEYETTLYNMLLPELESLSDLIRVLSIQIQIDIHDGHLEDALTNIRTGFAMGRHLGDAPFLLHPLVGIAMSRMMKDRVLQLTQAKAAPNLFWSLAALPRPLVDMRQAVEFEAYSALMMFPEIARADNVGGSRSIADFNAVLDRFEELGNNSFELGEEGEPRKQLQKTLNNPKAMDAVRSFLVKDAGYNQSKVDSLAPTQLLMIRERILYQRLSDKFLAASLLPYHQAREFYGQWNAEYANSQHQGKLPLLAAFLPAFGKTNEVSLRLLRSVEALKIVESIRSYTATNDGQLPESLDNLTLPVSVDPINGKAFHYKRDGDDATLWSDDGINKQFRFRLRVRK